MAGQAKDKAPQERSRRHHTRSRDGCTTCRKRHVRCDEARPTCKNCKIGSRNCDYAPAPIPFRERRAQEKIAGPPGAQEVWSVATVPANRALPSLELDDAPKPEDHFPAVHFFRSSGIDPFDTLAIKMPYKSQQLIRYFYNTADSFGVSATDPQEDCLAIVSHDSGALRSTLILAGLHYSWNVGEMSDFESTILFHKMECIRDINDLIYDSTNKAFTNCIRQVLTLTIAECCIGNSEVSRAHLRGLVAVINARASQPRTSPEDELDDELADRYLILVYNFIYGLKSLLTNNEDFNRLSGELQDKVTRYGTPDIDESTETSADHQPIDFRLSALRLMPFFFVPPAPRAPAQRVDVPAFLIGLREMTGGAEEAFFSPNLEEKVRIYASMWKEGPATRLFLLFVESHRKSFYAGRSFPPLEPSGELASAWSGVGATSGLYLNSVLDIWSIGEAMEPHMLRHFIRIVQRDVDFTSASIEIRGSPASELWLWKVFVAAMTVTKAVERTPAHEKIYAGLLDSFNAYLRLWKEVSGVKTWGEARRALRRIAWPERPLDDAMERSVWDTAMLQE